MKIVYKPLAPMGRDLERGEFLTKSLFITLSLDGRGVGEDDLPGVFVPPHLLSSPALGRGDGKRLFSRE